MIRKHFSHTRKNLYRPVNVVLNRTVVVDSDVTDFFDNLFSIFASNS